MVKIERLGPTIVYPSDAEAMGNCPRLSTVDYITQCRASMIEMAALERKLCIFYTFRQAIGDMKAWQ